MLTDRHPVAIGSLAISERPATAAVQRTYPAARRNALGPATETSILGQSYQRLSVAEAESIALISDVVQRNLRITQGYHDLKMCMTLLLGAKDVSWCAFACWASRTAGRFIRGEFIPPMVQTFLDCAMRVNQGVHTAYWLLTRAHGDQPPARSPAAQVLSECIEQAIRQVIENVALGNLIVFAEMGPLYARMFAMLSGATTYDRFALARFLSVLKPGPVADGGQDLLISAFTNYYEAMFETDPKKKAELILLANTQVGFHEQTRLQEPIMGALNAPFAEPVKHTMRARAAEIMPRRWGSVDGLIERVLQPVTAWLQETWYSVATRWLLRLELPTVCLSLGQDLPRFSSCSMFPEELATLENESLCALLYKLDFTPNTVVGSAAGNWGDLSDRMNFVVDFFRTRQQDQALYRQPFTHEQVKIIRAGGIPNGLL